MKPSSATPFEASHTPFTTYLRISGWVLPVWGSEAGFAIKPRYNSAFFDLI